MSIHIQNIKIDFLNNKLYLCVNNKYEEHFNSEKRIKDKLKNLIYLINDNKCDVKYYAGKGKFWYLYFKIKSENLIWFNKNKVIPKYISAFLDKFLYLFHIEKNGGGYYLLNVKSIYDYNLINIKLKTTGYRVLNCNINNPMTKFRAYSLSYYCYTEKFKDIYKPITYLELKKAKFKCMKLKKKYEFYNTNYNKYEILSYKMVLFHLQHIQYSNNDSFNSRLFIKYKQIVMNDGINLINLLLGLKQQAYIHYELNKSFFGKVGSGLYRMNMSNKKIIDNDFNDLLVEYRKCYKYNLKVITKKDLVKNYKKYYQNVHSISNSYKIIKS